jgi:signal transduction histidine kinase
MIGDSQEYSVAHLPLNRSLATKFSIFTALLVFWVAVIVLAYAVRHGSINLLESVMVTAVVVLAAGSIACFTILLLVRPLALLQRGLMAVGEGRLESLQISRTGDEIELVGESFNRMIEALKASREEIRGHHELLEERILRRTEDLEEATRRAELASQVKGEFLANMSHELRTPMTGVLGMIDMVLDGPLTTEQREQLETAQRCANSLLALLNDILDISKIEAGKMMIEHIPLDLRLLVADCVHSQEPRARDKGIRLSAAIPPEFPSRLMGDPLRLRQILNNLLSNAVKFTEVGSVVIRLSGSQAPGANRFHLEMQVADTGSGIPPEKLPVIFEKFTQADGSISRKYGGTGLGLAITSRLVEMHGGDIRVESEVGRGSTFYVTLPLELAQHDAATASSLPALAGKRARSEQTDEMSVLFVQLSPVRLERLRAAAYRSDEAEILSEAQKLQDAADRLAASDVSECARRIRQATACGDFEAVRSDLVRLEMQIRGLDSRPVRIHADAIAS